MDPSPGNRRGKASSCTNGGTVRTCTGRGGETGIRGPGFSTSRILEKVLVRAFADQKRTEVTQVRPFNEKTRKRNWDWARLKSETWRG